ncbi:hypothetical protein F3Y22_tig00110745pilonHSYRG00023 [Hibiscus syriacus]|uniref:Cullin N-terminal domain-containing protein n=1 Tax=Hibiscus syriacus TaxID=106335 RepID=A0A6A2ZSU6_HIBSY|nr:hypothetical protein F3Y22_tig00110745pilonHSYRG00023 [Hibiscus syriacus]
MESLPQWAVLLPSHMLMRTGYPSRSLYRGSNVMIPGLNVFYFLDLVTMSWAPTWNTLKLTFLTLGICLAIMLGLPFSSSESSLILHVSFLVLIIVALFLLLNWDNEQHSSKQNQGTMYGSLDKLSMLDLRAYLEKQGYNFYNVLCLYVMFLEQTGLVFIEHQMQEMDLIAKDHVIEHKANHIEDTPIISSSSLPSPYVCSSRTQLGVGSDDLSVTLGIVAAIGLGLLVFFQRQSPDLVVFLSFVEKCWQDLCDQMLMIRGITLYLDRTYVKKNPNVRSLWDMGLQLFRKYLSLALKVEYKTVTVLLRMIESGRLGEAVDRTLLNHILKMFTVLGIYSESFEKLFLEYTSEFYAAEGMKYMQQSDVPDYLKHVEESHVEVLASSRDMAIKSSSRKSKSSDNSIYHRANLPEREGT